MSLPDDIGRLFISRGGWIKSLEEQDEADQGYTMVATYVTDERLGLDYLAIREKFGDCEIRQKFGAYDHFAVPHSGKSLYVRKKGLVQIPDAVVERDWEKLIDHPFNGKVDEILDYAQQYRNQIVAKRLEEFKGLMETRVF